jgi:hypothetical protein
MANDLATQLAHLAETAKDLTAGVPSGGGGFGVLSTANKSFAVRRGDHTQRLLDERKRPRQEVEVVILAAAARLSKTYYASGYDPSATGAQAPTCYSLDGIAPDPSVATPQHHECATCPKNAWGSDRPGSNAKACTDRKRLAVVLAEDLAAFAAGELALAEPLLLSVPPKSFQSLARLQRQLNDLRTPAWAVVTQLSFDPNAAYPVLTMRLVRKLDATEIAAVLAIISTYEATVGAIIGTTGWTAPPIPAAIVELYGRYAETAAALRDEREAPDEPAAFPPPPPPPPPSRPAVQSSTPPPERPSRVGRRAVNILDEAAAAASAKVTWLMEDDEDA